MLYRILSDLIVIVHLAFVLFAVFGGFLLLKWKRLAWLHLPAVLWAALIGISLWSQEAWRRSILGRFGRSSK